MYRCSSCIARGPMEETRMAGNLWMHWALIRQSMRYSDSSNYLSLLQNLNASGNGHGHSLKLWTRKHNCLQHRQDQLLAICKDFFSGFGQASSWWQRQIVAGVHFWAPNIPTLARVPRWEDEVSICMNSPIHIIISTKLTLREITSSSRGQSANTTNSKMLAPELYQP